MSTASNSDVAFYDASKKLFVLFGSNVHKKIIHLKIYLAMRFFFKGFTRGRALGLAGPSPPVVTFFFLFQNFSISLSVFGLIATYLVKSDNEIGKYS